MRGLGRLDDVVDPAPRAAPASRTPPRRPPADGAWSRRPGPGAPDPPPVVPAPRPAAQDDGRRSRRGHRSERVRSAAVTGTPHRRRGRRRWSPLRLPRSSGATARTPTWRRDRPAATATGCGRMPRCTPRPAATPSSSTSGCRPERRPMSASWPTTSPSTSSPFRALHWSGRPSSASTTPARATPPPRPPPRRRRPRHHRARPPVGPGPDGPARRPHAGGGRRAGGGAARLGRGPRPRAGAGHPVGAHLHVGNILGFEGGHLLATPAAGHRQPHADAHGPGAQQRRLHLHALSARTP